MRVLVTGASGFLGSWVARELVRRGHDVRALVRKTSRLDNLEGYPIERAEGDVTDGASVAKALEGCQACVHTAGIAHFKPGVEKEMYAVNVGGVETVLGAAFEAKVKRAVLTSSVAAIGGSETPRAADETTPSNAEALGIDYLISKHRGEQKGLALAAKGLPLVVVRPSFILGPGDIYHSSATTILALARRSIGVHVGGGASYCDARDVAAGHAEALERGRPGEVYILAGHNFETAVMTAIVARVAGVPPPRRVPYSIAYAAAFAAEMVGKATGRPPDLSRQLIKASALFTFASSAKAQRDLGYAPRPFEESLRDTLRYFLRAGRLKPSTPELRSLAAEPPGPGEGAAKAGSAASSAGEA